MCIVLEPAHLSNTIIYAGEVQYRPGEPVHVIGYQNSVAKSSGGPNAMILPIPANGPIGPDNIVDSRSFNTILSNYGKAVERHDPNRVVTKGMRSLGVAAGAVDGFQVFESGSYTVALADTPKGLNEALKHVPANKRPTIPARFLIALGKLYADWPIALCCFDGAAMEEPEPLLWWFKPRFPDVLFAPAIDAHDGNPPSIEQPVDRDHIVAFSSYRMKGDIDQRLMSDIQLAGPHQWMFNPRFKGRSIKRPTGNGDFTLPISVLLDDSVPTWLPTLDVTAPPTTPRTAWDRIISDSPVN